MHDPFGTDGGSFDQSMVDIMSQALDGAYDAVKAEAKRAQATMQLCGPHSPN